MHGASPLDSPGLTVALALAVGIVAQAVARRLRVPGILVLLVVGVALGPDGANWIRPSLLGDGLGSIVGFAVAVILFEGGLSLSVRHLMRERRVIQRMVLLGPIVTTAGAALAARFILGWDWRRSVLFGTLVIVTGPTVVNPLMRRLNVDRRIRSVLEAEGILTDAIGAIVAVVALEIAVQPSTARVAQGFVEVATRLGFGAGFGLVSGYALALILRSRDLVPDRLRNVVTLGVVFLVYHGAESMLPESGIAAATFAGLVVGNVETHAPHELAEFKEQLTVMLIGMLFLLLVADVRIAEVARLGWPALGVVAALAFVVRPAQVWVATAGSDLSARERIFVSWIAPRGIVAAAIASLFAEELESRGFEGGIDLRSMVFVVIALTVLSAGATGGTVARLLRVRRPRESGWLVVGADPVGRAVARALLDAGDDVVSIDLDPEACKAAEAAGIRVLRGTRST